MDAWRLFVGVEVPERVRAAVDAAVDPLRSRWDRLRWTRSERWHLTLAFLGEVEVDRVPRAGEVVAQVASGAPPVVTLVVGEPGRFGTRVLWLAIEDDPAGALAATGRELQAALEGVGLPVDRKDVHPHLTLARSRGRDAQVRPAIVGACPSVEASWQVTDLVLWRSHLGAGARHEELVRAPLG